MDCKKFFLEFKNDDEGNLIQIDEPTGWSDMTLNLKTPDRKMFGRNFSFSDGEFPLTFEASYDTSVNGHQFERILQYDKTYGNGSCVNLYYNDCGEDLLIGRINFKGAVTDYCTYFEVNIIEDNKALVIELNEDVKADIKGVDTISDEVGYDLPFVNICLKSKLLRENAEQGIEIIQPDLNSPNPDYDETHNTIFWAGAQNGQLEHTATFFNIDKLQDEHILNNLFGGNELPIPINDYNFSFSQDFQQVRTKLDLNFATAFIRSTVGVDDVNWNVFLLHKDFQGNFLNVVDLLNVPIDSALGSTLVEPPNRPYQDGLSDGDFVNHNITNTSTFNDVSAGDTIGVFLVFRGNPQNSVLPKRLRLWLRTNQNSFFKVEGDSIKPDSLHEAPRLKDFFTKIVDYISDACVTVKMPEFEIGGEYYDYFLPNGYEVRNDGNIVDRQFVYNFKEAMKSINAIFCAGYQIFDDCVFIGTIKEFYKPLDCGLLDYPVVDYRVKYDSKLLLNEFEFKYKKVPKDEVNTIDEFNTSAQYSIPTDKTKGKCKVESDFIGSGYLLEEIRRKQFNEKPTESTSFDDDVFIVNSVFDATLGKYVNRTLENIQVTDGTLISPETSYNIAISPLQNFSRWSPYILSATHYQTDFSNIKVTDFEHNEFMESLVGDSSTLNTLEVQKGNYPRNVFSQHIFEPRTVDVTFSNVPIKDVLQIKDDLINKRGFHKVKNYKNEVVNIFILDFDYQICKEELTITGIKKNIDYV